jgi:hypothetical protein
MLDASALCRSKDWQQDQAHNCQMCFCLAGIFLKIDKWGGAFLEWQRAALTA